MTKTPNLDRARVNWGASPPDWIVALAQACDSSSQGRVGKQLNCSGAAVNQALGNSYVGRIDRIEQRVRGELMQETVACPVLGDMSKRVCQDNQRRPYEPTNSTRVRLFQACRTCPNREAQQ